MSLEAEKGIVSAVIKSAAVFDRVIGDLSADDFSHAASRVMFEAVSRYRQSGQPVDLVTLASAVQGTAAWEETGYGDVSEYLESLRSSNVGQRFIGSYIEIIRSNSVTRALHEYCGQIALIADDGDIPADEKLAKAQALFPMIQGGATSEFRSYYDAAKGAVEHLHMRMEGDVSGITSGMDNVDRMTLGWEPGTLNILAGRPSHGKSALSMDWVHAGSEQGAVFVFSLEMTAMNLAMRGLSSLGGVDYGDLRSAKIDDHMAASLQQAIMSMRDMPIYIDDRGGISVDQLRTRARIMARKDKPKIIVTDYLTLLSGEGENRTAQVGYVSRSLKAMAKELDCAVICLAQLNRGVDSRADKRPTLSDLRDSGEIEQDADIVMFTYLHEKYDPDTPRKGVGELIFAKQRNGETGSVFLEWQGRYQRFKPYDGTPPPMSSEGGDSKPARRSKKSFMDDY